MDGTSSDVELLLPHKRAVRASPPVGRAPVAKVMGYTLDISARFLAQWAIGRGSIETGDRILGTYWPRIFRAGNVELRARGRHNFARGQSYVVMSNHGSLLDIPALMGAVPGSLRMVTKEELTKVPIWGQALLASGFVPLDRGNREKAIRQLDRAKALLQKGVSVWISPEGTRARDGKLAAFKKGGFHIALDLGAPIMPTWIDGAAGIIPPDRFAVRHDGEVEVRFGAPIPTAGRTKEDLPALMAEVRAAILALSGRATEVDGTL